MAPSPRPRTALRLALAYAPVFAVLGVFVPYWALGLAGRGFDANQVGWILGAATVLRALSTPFWGGVADRLGRPRRVALFLSLGSLAVVCAHLPTSGFAVILVLGILFGCCHGPLIPLLDATAVAYIRDPVPGTRPLDYGRIRLWGSLAFLLATIGTGMAIRGEHAERVLYLLIGVLMLVVGAVLVLPAPPRAGEPVEHVPLGDILGKRPFLLMLAAVGLIQGSHGAYYVFSVLHWKNGGIDEQVSGFLWAEGVAAEILLFAVFSRFPVARPSTLLLVGGAGAVLRWIVLGATTSVEVLAAVQWLHAVSYGVTQLGAILWIGKHIPRARSSTAQTLLVSVMALGGAGAIRLTGALYGSWGGSVFHAMAALAVVGVAAAWALRRAGTPGPVATS